jgi:ABC-2 type transport system permease protein
MEAKMASNNALIAVKNRGWLNGFGNIFRKENHAWWGTWQWVIQIAIWMTIVNGMMAMITLAAPKIEEAQSRQEINEVEAAAARDALKITALTVFFVFSGLAPAVGVVIIAQDALIGEKQSGTAAWVLSKPVSRAAFLLSKLTADSLGVLATMVIAQGIAAYFIYKAGTGIALPIPGFLAALGLVMLVLLFYLSLTYMLGTLFRKRGAVIGIPMVLVFGNQLVGLAPWLGKVMPWNLVMDLGPDRPSLAVALAQSQSLPTITPIVGTVLLTIVFIAVALWRFQREEF